MLTADLWLFAVSVPLVELFSQELEELVGILFLGGNKVLERLFLRNPEPRQYICSGIAVCRLQSIEILKHVIHSTAQTVRDLAVTALVTIAKIEIPKQRIVQEAL